MSASIIAREKRAGILPNRDAGSKRKLNESFAQTSQNVHSFSTADYFVAFSETLHAELFLGI
jgi:hypothetical protein